MLARPAQVDNGLHVLRYYTDLAKEFEPETRITGVYSPAIIRQEPVGTVAAILPWNVPFFLAMLKVAPARHGSGLHDGAQVRSETPLNANLLAEAAQKVGVPAGALNVICAGPESSELLVTHPGIDKVAFTGSTAVGKRIAGLAGAQLKCMTLELGGKSAAIVLDDADLAATMPRLIGVSMSLTGQFCTAQSRILVQRDRYDEAVELYAGVAASLPVGGALDAGSFGPAR